MDCRKRASNEILRRYEHADSSLALHGSPDEHQCHEEGRSRHPGHQRLEKMFLLLRASDLPK
jgi:hypothetical protein